MRCFMYEYEKVTNLEKLYLLTKIHKRLYDVPGRRVISNCGTPTENVSELIMQEGWSYIKDAEDCLKKIQNMGKISQNSILVTADVAGLYPNIPHNTGLKALKDKLDCRQNEKIPTGMPVKMAKFFLTNTYFEFGQKVFHQISETAIGTKVAPPYACIFMDTFETNFRKTHELQPFVWFRYIDDVFFIWSHGKEEFENFIKE